MNPLDLEAMWGPVAEVPVQTFPNLLTPPEPLVVDLETPVVTEKVISRINPQTFVPGRNVWSVLDEVLRAEQETWESPIPSPPPRPPVTASSFEFSLTRRCRYKDASEPCWDAVPGRGFDTPPKWKNISACLGHCGVSQRQPYFTPDDLLTVVGQGGGIPEVFQAQYARTVVGRFPPTEMDAGLAVDHAMAEME